MKRCRICNGPLGEGRPRAMYCLDCKRVVKLERRRLNYLRSVGMEAEDREDLPGYHLRAILLHAEELMTQWEGPELRAEFGDGEDGPGWPVLETRLWWLFIAGRTILRGGPIDEEVSDEDGEEEAGEARE